MTTDELDRALRQFRLGGMADALTARAQQARADVLGPLDFLSLLVHDELERRRDRLIDRRVKEAGFRHRKTLDTFNWSFNGIDRALLFDPPFQTLTSICPGRRGRGGPKSSRAPGDSTPWRTRNQL
jgi:hypothetical protein